VSIFGYTSLSEVSFSDLTRRVRTPRSMDNIDVWARATFPNLDQPLLAGGRAMEEEFPQRGRIAQSRSLYDVEGAAVE
jgi:hypothetical protein